MNMTLNIILAAFNLGLALLAIDGKKWNKNEHRLLKRLTYRISIILLVIIFGVTVFKEIKTSQREGEMEQRISILLHEKLQSTEKNLADLIVQKKGSSTKADPRVIEAEKNIQEIRKELRTLDKSGRASRANQDKNKSPINQPRGPEDKGGEDEYNEITKPIMEVK
jgi:hypothetical protein